MIAPGGGASLQLFYGWRALWDLVGKTTGSSFLLFLQTLQLFHSWRPPPVSSFFQGSPAIRLSYVEACSLDFAVFSEPFKVFDKKVPKLPLYGPQVPKKLMRPFRVFLCPYRCSKIASPAAKGRGRRGTRRAGGPAKSLASWLPLLPGSLTFWLPSFLASWLPRFLSLASCLPGFPGFLASG